MKLSLKVKNLLRVIGLPLATMGILEALGIGDVDWKVALTTLVGVAIALYGLMSLVDMYMENRNG